MSRAPDIEAAPDGYIFTVLPSHQMSKLRLRKGQAWHQCHRGPRYLPDCILRAIAALTRPTYKPSGSISALPPELLHAIFELLAFSGRNTLAICLRVCRRWHGIARLQFFTVVPVGYYDANEHFSRLLSAEPRLVGHVKEVRFIDEWMQGTRKCRYNEYGGRGTSAHPFDIHVPGLALPIPGLVNLRYLSLMGFHNKKHCSFPPLCRQRPADPTPLQRLSCHHCHGLPHILPSLLSLFEISTLDIRVHPDEPRSSPWLPPTNHSGIPPASIKIQDLILETYGELNTEGYYRFFERTLAPGSLRALGTKALDAQDFGPQFSRFLSCDAARNLLSISVEVSQLMEKIDRTTGFECLGAAIAHCTRLQCFRIQFRHRDGTSQLNPGCHRTTFDPILANLPGTLCAFAIHIKVYSLWAWLDFCSEVAGLDVVDRALSPSPPGPGGGGSRFPHLRRVELDVLQKVSELAKVKKSKFKRWLTLVEDPPHAMPLPRLKAAGLLRARVTHKPLDMIHWFSMLLFKKIADLYLPPEMS